MATTHFKRSGIQVGVLSVLTTLNMPAAAVEAADIASNAVTGAKIAAATISLGTGTTGVAMGKLDAIIAIGSTNSSNTEVTVTHGLGRVPVGYILIGSDLACNIYDSTTFTATHLKIKCDVASVVYNLMIW